MIEKAESRDKIKEGIQRRRLESDERAKHMGLVVEDKKTVADTSNKLRLSTTSEGAQEVKGAIKKAAQETKSEFERQNNDLEKKMQECKKAEKDLQQRTESAKKDAQDAKQAAGRVKETKGAKGQALAAEHAAVKDGKFVSDQRQKQELDRKKSEERRAKQKGQLENAKLKF
jgi:type IV secretory pathway VirB10-like protein